MFDPLKLFLYFLLVQVRVDLVQKIEVETSLLIYSVLSKRSSEKTERKIYTWGAISEAISNAADAN